MKKEECAKYEECSAALCPLEENLDSSVWYPDEEICQSRSCQRIDWVSKQKKIVKAKASLDKYFTVEMLKSATRIKKGVEGVDPDQTLEQAHLAERRWMGKKGKDSTSKKVKKTISKPSKKKVSSKKTGKKRGRPKKKT